ncbi:hypothetical protein GCM10023143_08610 [Compostibacter hankyongensis]|uniref:Uncharacterized protein n=2 Tax=Compostibacter hankyongensis TaxID=1007089 RepID=A0ABP8FI28_9BACT
MLVLAGNIPFFSSAKGDPIGKGEKIADDSCVKRCPPRGVEEFIFMSPRTQSRSQEDDKCVFYKSITEFYKWYLQHEDMIRTALSGDNREKDFLPPLNLSWENLHEYFEYIKTHYPDVAIRAGDNSAGRPAELPVIQAVRPAAPADVPDQDITAPDEPSSSGDVHVQIIAR